MQDSGAIQSCFLTRLLDEHDQDGSKNARREMLVKHTAAQLYLGKYPLIISDLNLTVHYWTYSWRHDR